MHIDLFMQILWLFFVYAFLGWMAETIYAIIKGKHFANRGVLNGPVCCVYGIAGVIVSIGFAELRDSWIFLFLGSMGVSTLVEWLAGRFLEKLKHRRWWDYSEKKWNLDGYICLQYSILWGVLGVLGLKYVNPLLMQLYGILPMGILRIVLIVLVGILAVDMIGTVVIAYKIPGNFDRIEEMNSNIDVATHRFGNWLARHINARMERAYPELEKKIVLKPASTVFAEGCTFYKVVMLFFVGAFLGDITETIFCRLTMGVWMSRSSVVWGPFSIVWGLAMAVATPLLYNYREQSDSKMFIAGTVLGGVYEYLCSVFTEIVFGKVFWDYSKIPFNLGGRINLLYCFFWGIAAVVWMKRLYPTLSKWIEKIPMKPGKVISWLLIVFMICNIFVSSSALMRYSQREQGEEPVNAYDSWIDTHYDDAVMVKIYPKAKTKR